MPEPISKQEVGENDGERNAAKRFIATLRRITRSQMHHPEESLSSNAAHRDPATMTIVTISSGQEAIMPTGQAGAGGRARWRVA